MGYPILGNFHVDPYMYTHPLVNHHNTQAGPSSLKKEPRNGWQKYENQTMNCWMLYLIQDSRLPYVIMWYSIYLVGGIPTPLKNVKVSWDDEIPNIWKNKIHVPNHQPDTLRSSNVAMEKSSVYRWIFLLNPCITGIFQPATSDHRNIPTFFRKRRYGGFLKQGNKKKASV